MASPTRRGIFVGTPDFEVRGEMPPGIEIENAKREVWLHYAGLTGEVQPPSFKLPGSPAVLREIAGALVQIASVIAEWRKQNHMKP